MRSKSKEQILTLVLCLFIAKQIQPTNSSSCDNGECLDQAASSSANANAIDDSESPIGLSKRTSRFLRIGKGGNHFLRIGKSFDDDDEADNFDEDKRAHKFLRIGKAHKFLRIGKSGDAFDDMDDYEKRAHKFLRIGKADPWYDFLDKRAHKFLRIGKSFEDDSDVGGYDKRAHKFLRIGKSLDDDDEMDVKAKRHKFLRIGRSPNGDEGYVFRDRRGMFYIKLGNLPSSPIIPIGRSMGDVEKYSRLVNPAFLRLGKRGASAKADGNTAGVSKKPDKNQTAGNKDVVISTRL